MKGDLHLHTVFSDGSLTPEQLIDRASDRKINVIAVTDHDTTGGLTRALEYAVSKEITVVPGIEFSTRKREREIHLLGYFIEPDNKQLQRETEFILKSRRERAQKMVDLLQQRGLDLSFFEVEELAGKKGFIGRPHIARLMVQKGYISSMEEAFSDSFIGRGGQAYVERYRVSLSKAITLIKQAGGFAAVAHPGSMEKGSALSFQEIKELKKQGVTGLEVFHSQHGDRDTKSYREIAARLDLIVTGGSDFHGNCCFGIEIGIPGLDGKELEKFLAHGRFF